MKCTHIHAIATSRDVARGWPFSCDETLVSRYSPGACACDRADSSRREPHARPSAPAVRA